MNSIKIEHDVDDTPRGFSHRLIVRRTTDNAVLAEGRWAQYKDIAAINYGGKEYRAVTNFYDGEFPSNQPFLITLPEECVV